MGIDIGISMFTAVTVVMARLKSYRAAIKLGRAVPVSWETGSQRQTTPVAGFGREPIHVPASVVWTSSSPAAAAMAIAAINANSASTVPTPNH